MKNEYNLMIGTIIIFLGGYLVGIIAGSGIGKEIPGYWFFLGLIIVFFGTNIIANTTKTKEKKE